MNENMKAGFSPVRTRSEIEEVTEALETSITSLQSNLDILYDRLGHVMLQMGDNALKGASPTPIRSPLGNQIEQQAERVQALVGVTGRILTSLVLP